MKKDNGGTVLPYERDGGPAFPRPVGTNGARSIEDLYVNDPQEGMSLRDYFAAAALQTMKLANSWSDNPLYWEGVARSAYVCADAMLAEKNK